MKKRLIRLLKLTENRLQFMNDNKLVQRVIMKKKKKNPRMEQYSENMNRLEINYTKRLKLSN